jgi:hypothetical protein
VHELLTQFLMFRCAEPNPEKPEARAEGMRFLQ